MVFIHSSSQSSFCPPSSTVYRMAEEPVVPGCFIRAKAIWFMPIIDQGEKDDKIIAIYADDPEYRHYTDIKGLPPHRLAEVRRFFNDCILFKKDHIIYFWVSFSS
ncbi:hypothetical protein ACS0TY_007462 [Phlomoides rotata]